MTEIETYQKSANSEATYNFKRPPVKSSKRLQTKSKIKNMFFMLKIKNLKNLVICIKLHLQNLLFVKLFLF